MISSMTNKPTVNLPKQLPTLDLHEALHSNNIEYKPDTFTIKKKRKYKTIHELNPNPNLLSKKALKTREMRMKSLKNKNYDDDPLFAQASNVVETKLGGRQLQLLKSPNPAFSKDVPTNYIRPEKSEEQNINLHLGSRQKNLANNHRLSSAESYFPIYRKQANDFSKSQHNSHIRKQRLNPNEKSSSNLRNSSKKEISLDKSKKSVAVLGSRQLQLLKSRISNEKNKPTPKQPRTKQPRTNRRRKGKVRKVLTGRRKITSSELILKADSFFQ